MIASFYKVRVCFSCTEKGVNQEALADRSLASSQGSQPGKQSSSTDLILLAIHVVSFTGRFLLLTSPSKLNLTFFAIEKADLKS